MGIKVFKYKSALDNSHSKENVSMSPGFVTYGKEGDKGKKGTHGTGVFLCNYELDNSYYRELAIEKIKSGDALSNNHGGKIGREYVDGDLVLTKSLSCYRISISDGIYELEYLGRVKRLNTNSSIIDSVKRIDISLRYGIIPSVGTYNHRVISNSSDDMRKMPVINGDISLIFMGDDHSLLDNYFLSIEVKIPCEKSLQYDSIALTPFYDDEDIHDPVPGNLYRTFKFYKALEFPIDAITDASGNTIGGIGHFTISELSADSLHPFGNEISSTIVNGTISSATTGGSSGADSDTKWFTHIDSDGRMKTYDSSDDASAWLDSSLQGMIDGSTTAYSSGSYNDSSMMLRFSKYDGIGAHNYRGGESNYFSGMPLITSNPVYDAMSYQDYLNDASVMPSTEDLKANLENMGKYILGNNCEYTLICQDRNTNRVKYIDISNLIHISR